MTVMKKLYLIFAIIFLLSTAGCTSAEKTPFLSTKIPKNLTETDDYADILDIPKTDVPYEIVYEQDFKHESNIIVDNIDNVITRRNDYTNKPVYSYRIDSVKIEIKKNTIDIFVDGEELYDAHGSDTNRRLVLKSVLTDNEGYIISSDEMLSDNMHKKGDILRDEKFDRIFQNINFNEKYHLNITSPDSNYDPPAADNAPNPNRNYCIHVSYQINETIVPPVDINNLPQWFYEYREKSPVLTHDMKLYWIKDTPVDLNNIQQEIFGPDETSDKNKDFIMADKHYGCTYYYDIPVDRIIDDRIPANQRPDIVRLSYSPQGNRILDINDRYSLNLVFLYRNNNETYYFIMFTYVPGNTLTAAEWEEIQQQ